MIPSIPLQSSNLPLSPHACCLEPGKSIHLQTTSQKAEMNHWNSTVAAIILMNTFLIVDF
jgi:hypothetical protein